MEGLLYYPYMLFYNTWWIFAILGLVWFTDLVDYFFDKWGM